MVDARSLRESRRPLARRAILAAGALGLFFHLCCAPSFADNLNETSIDGPSRLLDDACRAGGCVVDGSATLVSGVTADSTAIRIGPGAGSARVTISAKDVVPDGFSWHFELLASGTGSFGVQTPPCGLSLGAALSAAGTNAQPVRQTVAPSGGYQWIPLSEVCDSASASVPPTLSITSAADDSLIDIVDVRIKSESGGGYCSIARVGDRRRRWR